jgi:exodeoxyribonuclease VIII
MNNIMLDLETMSTASNAAILSIGAVKFSNKIDDEFYSVVDLKTCTDVGLEIDNSTIEWWNNQSPEARQVFNEIPITLEQMLKDFSNWIGDKPMLWGNGSDFDNVILSNAYKACGIEQPWAYYNNRCFRTLRALYPTIKFENSGTYHNALDDARSQALHMIKIFAGAA